VNTVRLQRASGGPYAASTITVTVDDGANRIITLIETISLSKLTNLNGTIVISTKSYANKAIALELIGKAGMGPVEIVPMLISKGSTK
jgi:hypothetical protein